MELVFENNLKLPDGFYLTIMNLLKRYYEDHGTSFEKIHELLNQNEKKIDPELFKSIKSFFKEKEKKYRDEEECCNKCKRIFAITVILIFLMGLISPIVYTIIIK
jgi:hypothetical protein